MPVVLFLPAYNEAGNLPRLFDELSELRRHRGIPDAIVVIDDGSTDETPHVLAQWAQRLPLDWKRHAGNCGLGPTLREGLHWAATVAGPAGIVVAMDADGTHPVSLIPALVQRLKEGYDVVVASRYQPGAQVVGLGYFRRILTRGARLLYQWLFPLPGLRDYTSGFRAYRASLLQQLFDSPRATALRERGFASTAELLLLLRGLGARVSEVPLVLRYDLKQGASKMKVAQTVFTTLRLMWRSGFSGRRAPGPGSAS